VRRSQLIREFRVAVIVAVTTFLLTASGQALAQGFDLSQLLGGAGGGGGSRHQHTDGGQGNGSGISVQRSVPPLTGKFSGKQDDKDAEITLTAQFACYPANDSDIPQARAYVCYTGGSNNGGPRTVDPPAYGSPARGSLWGPPSGGGLSNGPPSGVE
jgi:hypothetical protein